MTTYQHPRGVQLINCDCEYCQRAVRPIVLEFIDAPERCTQCGSRGMERYCSRLTCGMPVPNRLYGAEINHEGDAI